VQRIPTLLLLSASRTFWPLYPASPSKRAPMIENGPLYRPLCLRCGGLPGKPVKKAMYLKSRKPDAFTREGRIEIGFPLGDVAMAS
jgi:hypothetical protein